MPKDLSNKEVIQKQEDDVTFLQFRRLLEYPELVHCYTLSTNGFDIARNDASKEQEEKVYQNYQTLANRLKINSNEIIRPNQTHTDVVKCIEKLKVSPEDLRDVDGLITNQPQVFFSLSFADCTPIYLYDPIKKVIGNIHSGWKGTLKGIGKKAVEKMVECYHCHPKNIVCCLGPHIRKCHFEVGQEIAIQFENQYQNMQDIHDIISYIGEIDGKKKYYIDTAKINRNLMLKIGLKKENIIDSNICTVCEKHQMHSYRAQGKMAGRNVALMGMIKK